MVFSVGLLRAGWSLTRYLFSNRQVGASAEFHWYVLLTAASANATAATTAEITITLLTFMVFSPECSAIASLGYRGSNAQIKNAAA